MDGRFPADAGDHLGAAGDAAPRAVRIVSSRVGAHGGRVVAIATDR